MISKQGYNLAEKAFYDVPLTAGATGVAMAEKSFSHGAERLAFRCTEYSPSSSSDLGSIKIPSGHWLVAKETFHDEQLKDASFHKRTAKMHATAAAFAVTFNSRVKRLRDDSRYQVSFVPVHIYEVVEYEYGNSHGRAWILAEGCARKGNSPSGIIMPVELL